MTYYEIINADDSVLRSKDMPDGFDPADVAHKFGPSFRSRIIPQVELPDPTVDEATQRLGRVVETVEADRVTVQRELLTKTAEELAAEAEEADRQVDIAAIKSVAIALRDGEGTAAVRLSRVERVLFRILKDTYGDSV